MGDGDSEGFHRGTLEDVHDVGLRAEISARNHEAERLRDRGVLVDEGGCLAALTVHVVASSIGLVVEADGNAHRYFPLRVDADRQRVAAPDASLAVRTETFHLKLCTIRILDVGEE